MTDQYGSGGINLTQKPGRSIATTNESGVIDGSAALWMIGTDGDDPPIMILATAASMAGRSLYVISPDAGSSGIEVAVMPVSGELLNGASDGIALQSDFETVCFFSDGVAWYAASHSSGSYPTPTPPAPPPPPVPGGDITAAGFSQGDGTYFYSSQVGYVNVGGSTLHAGDFGGTSYVIYSKPNSWLAFSPDQNEWRIFDGNMPNPNGGYSDGDPIPATTQVPAASASVTTQEGTEGPDAASAIVGTLSYSS